MKGIAMTMAIQPVSRRRRSEPKTTPRKPRSKNCDSRRESKAVAEFERWALDNAKELGKWARQNTKRLTGKEIL
jgi:hypothetical protein